MLAFGWVLEISNSELHEVMNWICRKISYFRSFELKKNEIRSIRAIVKIRKIRNLDHKDQKNSKKNILWLKIIWLFTSVSASSISSEMKFTPLWSFTVSQLSEFFTPASSLIFRAISLRFFIESCGKIMWMGKYERSKEEVQE